MRESAVISIARVSVQSARRLGIVKAKKALNDPSFAPLRFGFTVLLIFKFTFSEEKDATYYISRELHEPRGLNLYFEGLKYH